MSRTLLKKFFSASCETPLQLWDKLIKNENIELLELLKNSYDADARHVTVGLGKRQ
jgi:hypothetical protein